MTDDHSSSCYWLISWALKMSLFFGICFLLYFIKLSAGIGFRIFKKDRFFLKKKFSPDREITKQLSRIIFLLKNHKSTIIMHFLKQILHKRTISWNDATFCWKNKQNFYQQGGIGSLSHFWLCSWIYLKFWKANVKRGVQLCMREMFSWNK